MHFSAAILGWYSQLISLGHLTALGQRARFQVLPSVGTFGYEPQTRTLFGLVRGIEAHRVYMNARASVQIASHDGDPEARSALNLQTGLLGSAASWPHRSPCSASTR